MLNVDDVRIYLCLSRGELSPSLGCSMKIILTKPKLFQELTILKRNCLHYFESKLAKILLQKL